LYCCDASLSEVISISPEWWISTASAKVIVGFGPDLRFAHSLGLFHGHLARNNALFNGDGVNQMTNFCLSCLMEPERNSSGMINVGGLFAECCTPTSDARAFTEVLSEITMGGSKVKGMRRPGGPGFGVEIIERGLSGDSRNANSFVAIFEIVKQSCFEIVADVDCDEVLKFTSWVESSEQSVQ
jgi:hypothetical protein